MPRSAYDITKYGVPVGLADVVDPDDVVGVGPAQDPRLLEEPLADVEPLRPVVGQRLDRDVGVELVVVVEPDASRSRPLRGARPAAAGRDVRGGTRAVLCLTGDRTDWEGNVVIDA